MNTVPVFGAVLFVSSIISCISSALFVRKSDNSDRAEVAIALGIFLFIVGVVAII